jgi:Domain of unknown function (DUF4328)
MTPSHSPYNSAHFRAGIVKILLIVGAIAAGISLLAEALSLAFPPLTENQEIGENMMSAGIALVIFLLAILEFFIYVTTVVFFLMWLYRSYNNLRAFNSRIALDHSAGWAVGSFFVPFINLAVPYRAVKEVWQKSWPADETLLYAPSPPATFAIWWTFWLLSCFAGNISMRLSFNENVPENAATVVSIIASGLSIIAAAFAYLVVDAIDKRQEETSRKVNLEGPSGPPPPVSFPPVSDVVAPSSYQ